MFAICALNCDSVKYWALTKHCAVIHVQLIVCIDLLNSADLIFSCDSKLLFYEMQLFLGIGSLIQNNYLLISSLPNVRHTTSKCTNQGHYK